MPESIVFIEGMCQNRYQKEKMEGFPGFYYFFDHFCICLSLRNRVSIIFGFIAYGYVWLFVFEGKYAKPLLSLCVCVCTLTYQGLTESAVCTWLFVCLNLLITLK